MTDDFQRGLITGLAMQPLQVTTEHATPDSIEGTGGDIVIGTYTTLVDGVVAGDIVVIPLETGA